jgi:hypothetical protein
METTENTQAPELTPEEIAAQQVRAIVMGTKLTYTKLDKSFTGDTLTLSFFAKADDGEKTDKTKPALTTVSIDLSTMPEAVKHQAMLHGFSQKFGDNLAIGKDDKDTFTIKMAVEKTDNLKDQMMNGDWNAKGKTKAESMSVDKVQAQFLAGIAAGITTWEQANTLYKMMAGKELPKPE